jgi:hypothetical protein
MPVIRHKRPSQKHVHVYRPDGTRYVNGATKNNVVAAVASAFEAWEREFGAMPKTEHSFIEVLGVTGGWAATLFEIKD